MKYKCWLTLIVLVVVIVSVFLFYESTFKDMTETPSEENNKALSEKSDDLTAEKTIDTFREETSNLPPEESANLTAEKSANLSAEETTKTFPWESIVIPPEESADLTAEETANFTAEEITDVFSQRRMRMVEVYLKGRDIIDEKVLDAMERVPRHKFVEESLWTEAYADHPLPIGEGQTISQPYVVALMTQALHLTGSEKVLEIGTGSGYQAAVLAEIVEEVYTVEIREKLATMAENNLSNLGYTNVHVKCSDGYFGWEEHAPYDAIMITCAVNHIPPSLISQLKEDGYLILPLGPTTYYQSLTLLEKTDEGLSSEYISSVLFVPMIGEALEH